MATTLNMVPLEGVEAHYQNLLGAVPCGETALFCRTGGHDVVVYLGLGSAIEVYVVWLQILGCRPILMVPRGGQRVSNEVA